MVHPVRKMIEQLHGRGACPRIQVDLTADGVVCPDFLLERWGEELVIDLDPSYPLDLAFTDDAVEADLAFDGFVARCTFPFASIYIVADRETGKGIVLEENMPESVRRKRQPAPAPAPTPQVADGARAAGKRDRPGKSRRRRRPGTEPEPAAAPEPAPEPAAAPPRGPALAPVPEAEPKPRTGPALVTEDDGDDDEAAASSPSDDEAKRRRAVFSVIDGDG